MKATTMTAYSRVATVWQNPDHFTYLVTLPNGEVIVFRPLQPDDAARLGAYFAELSADTRRRYAPHDFTLAMAQE